MNVNEKINELIVNVDKAEHKFPHIHGDCNLTHFGHCFKYVDLDGLWLEFGVYKGGSIGTIATCNPNKTIYGFDSFEGLPEFWNKENPKGTFTLQGEVPPKIFRGSNIIHGEVYQDWNPNISLIKGLFEDVLPKFVEEHSENIAFIHVDSDLYSSAKTIFKFFKDRIIPGTVICFDDWCGYPDCVNRDHEIKAFAEFLLETNFGYKTISFQTYPTCSQTGFLIEILHKMKIVTDHAVAYDSPDHIFPWGTKRDNTTDLGFIAEIENYFDGKKIKTLDIGCSGGQLTIDFNNRGHAAIGIEGSDYSVLHNRANWPQHHNKCLFTCDAAKPFEIVNDKDRPVQFDLITAWEVVEHICPDGLEQFFFNIKKHMTTDAIFCASIAPIPDVVEGHVLHQSVFNKKTWYNEILPKYFTRISELPFHNKVRYGDSFHVMIQK